MNSTQLCANRWRYLYGILLFLILSVNVANSAEKQLKFTTGEWPPYISQNAKDHGILPQIISESFALEGYEVGYDFFPWKRSYELAKDGFWDGSLCWVVSPERNKDFIFSDPLFTARTVFFHRKDFNFDWEKIEDFENIRIGITRGYIYAPGLLQTLKKTHAKIIDSDTEIINFKLLLDKRIDVFLLDVLVGKELLKNNFKDTQTSILTYHPRAIANEPSQHIIFPKKNFRSSKRMKAFNRGLKKLKASGRYQQILSNINQTETN